MSDMKKPDLFGQKLFEFGVFKGQVFRDGPQVAEEKENALLFVYFFVPRITF